MNHETARERLLEAAYGDLEAGEERDLEAHLRECPECRAERARLEETRALYRGLGDEPLPGEAVVLAAARRAAGEAASRRRAPWLRLSWATAAAAAVVVVAGGVSLKILSMSRKEAEPALAAAPEASARPAAEAEEGRPVGVVAVPPVPRAAPPAPSRREPAADAEARLAPAPRGPEAGRPAAAPRSAPREPVGEQLREKAAPGPAGVGMAASTRAQPAEPLPSGAPVPLGKRELAAAPAAQAETKEAAARGRASADEAAPGGEEAFADDLVRELRRRREAGELNEAQRRPEPCPGGDVRRVAWLDGMGVARRLARTAPLPPGMGLGEAVRDQYYDDAGRLRLVVVDGSGPAGRFRRRLVLDEVGRRVLEDPPGSPWPEADLVRRDPAAAFWGPQRCAPAGR